MHEVKYYGYIDTGRAREDIDWVGKEYMHDIKYYPCIDTGRAREYTDRVAKEYMHEVKCYGYIESLIQGGGVATADRYLQIGFVATAAGQGCHIWCGSSN